MAQYHQVEQGECLVVLAQQYGFTDYHAIWDHPKNSALKSKRQNPNVLATGDILYIPDKQDKQESRATAQSHAFQVGAATVLYKTVIKDGKDQPLANAAYILTLENKVCTGTTDGNGLLQQEIPLDAQTAKLTLKDLGLSWTLNFGNLDPIDTVSGVQQRLKSLGYDPGAVDGTENPGLTAALRAFQKANSLTADGTCSSATRDKLKEKHGC